jgi:hypothetical protein
MESSILEKVEKGFKTYCLNIVQELAPIFPRTSSSDTSIRSSEFRITAHAGLRSIGEVVRCNVSKEG